MIFKWGRFFLIFLSVVGSFCNSALARKSISEVFSDLFYDSSPKLEIPYDFIKNDLQDGVWARPEVGYAFQFRNHPADPNRFLRQESLNLTLTIPANPAAQLPVQLGPSLKAEFIRPFEKVNPIKTIGDFLTTSPAYGPSRVPLNYENALKLKHEDYFSFTANLALQVAPSIARASGIDFIGDLSFIRYILSGDFRVEVYRLSGSKVKVIASSLRSKAVGVGAQLRFVPDLEVFGFSLVDNFINKKIQANIIDWTLYEKNKGHLLSVSYIYDLNDESGRIAYDSLMDPRQWRKPTIEFNKIISGKPKSLEKTLWLADTSVSQDFAEKQNAGVTYINESEIEYEQFSKGIRFDVLVADQNRRRHFLEADFTHQSEATQTPQNYKIANFEVYDDHQFLINISESKVRRQTTLVFDSDTNLQISNFRELHFLYLREDKKLKENSFQNEASSILGEMRKLVPKELLGQDLAKLNDMLKPAYTKKDAAWVQMELSFNPLSLSVVQKLNFNDISWVIDSFMNEAITLITSNKKEERFYYGSLELHNVLAKLKPDSQATYFSDLKTRKIKEQLYQAFQRSYTAQQNEIQWELFKDLQNNIIFRDFGAAFLIRLLAYGSRKNANLSVRDLMYFKARVKVKNENEKLIHIGHYSRSETTLALLTQKDRVMNRSYSLFHFIE